jgi:CheY-like chemotaxis protein
VAIRTEGRYASVRVAGKHREWRAPRWLSTCLLLKELGKRKSLDRNRRQSRLARNRPCSSSMSQGLRTAVREFLVKQATPCLKPQNGMEAWQISEGYQGRIDLLLTDYIMPGLRGPRLGTLAMRQQPNLRIISMSGYPDRVTQIPDSCKTITFLQKPFSLSMLAQTVRHVLNDDQPYSASA